jgi:hypothetical protein
VEAAGYELAGFAALDRAAHRPDGPPRASGLPGAHDETAHDEGTTL